jgi:hypothetical protein
MVAGSREATVDLLRCGVRLAYERVCSSGKVGKPRFTGTDGVCDRADTVSEVAFEVSRASRHPTGPVVAVVIY